MSSAQRFTMRLCAVPDLGPLHGLSLCCRCQGEAVVFGSGRLKLGRLSVRV